MNEPKFTHRIDRIEHDSLYVTRDMTESIDGTTVIDDCEGNNLAVIPGTLTDPQVLAVVDAMERTRQNGVEIGAFRRSRQLLDLLGGAPLEPVR